VVDGLLLAGLGLLDFGVGVFMVGVDLVFKGVDAVGHEGLIAIIALLAMGFVVEFRCFGVGLVGVVEDEFKHFGVVNDEAGARLPLIFSKYFSFIGLFVCKFVDGFMG
jgi:hypothetical protein